MNPMRFSFFLLFQPLLTHSHNTASISKILANLYSTADKESTIISDSQLTTYTDKYLEFGLVYGEITPESVHVLFNDIKITDQDVFYDLGSGFGKMVIQAYLTTPIKKSVGIEYVQERYNVALTALNKLYDNGWKQPNKEINFICGDFLEQTFDDATIVYLASQLWYNCLFKPLVEKLSHLKKGLKVFTLQKLFNAEEYNFFFIKEYMLPMSWNHEGKPVYLYELR